MMESLHSALSFGGILPRESIQKIISFFVPKKFKSNDYFLNAGKVANEIGFVDTGIFRSFATGRGGEEVTKYFIRQNQFMVDLESYYEQKPSESSLQAVVESKLFVISRSSWTRLNEDIPKLYILTKSLTEATLLNKIKDNDFLNYGTAKDKYQEFIKRYPDLIREVPQQYIASYLKITPQSLSRIRKTIV